MSKFVEILDRHVDQEALLKDLANEYVLPMIEEKLANLDLIPGTDLDKDIILKVIAAIKGLVL